MINKRDSVQQSAKSQPNLGQKEAKLEKARKESLGHMEDEDSAQRRKKKADKARSPNL